MNEGCQGLLVAAAAAYEETINWSAISIRLHRQLVTEQQPSYTRTHKQKVYLSTSVIAKIQAQ